MSSGRNIMYERTLTSLIVLRLKYRDNPGIKLFVNDLEPNDKFCTGVYTNLCEHNGKNYRPQSILSFSILKSEAQNFVLQTFFWMPLTNKNLQLAIIISLMFCSWLTNGTCLKPIMLKY